MGTSKKRCNGKRYGYLYVSKGYRGRCRRSYNVCNDLSFATFQMGLYSTVNIAITTIGMVAIQWLVQSVLRYVNKYDILNQQRNFTLQFFQLGKE